MAASSSQYPAARDSELFSDKSQNSLDPKILRTMMNQKSLKNGNPLVHNSNKEIKKDMEEEGGLLLTVEWQVQTGKFGEDSGSGFLVFQLSLKDH